MNQELMDIVMDYFVKENIRDLDRLKELKYLYFAFEEDVYMGNISCPRNG